MNILTNWKSRLFVVAIMGIMSAHGAFGMEDDETPPSRKRKSPETSTAGENSEGLPREMPPLVSDIDEEPAPKKKSPRLDTNSDATFHEATIKQALLSNDRDVIQYFVDHHPKFVKNNFNALVQNFPYRTVDQCLFDESIHILLSFAVENKIDVPKRALAPLMYYAIKLGHKDCFEYLICRWKLRHRNHSPGLKIVRPGQRTKHYYILNSTIFLNPQMVPFVLEKMPSIIDENDGTKPIALAAQLGQLENVQLIWSLVEGKSRNESFMLGYLYKYTLLESAVRSGNLALVDWIRSKVNSISKEDWNRLHVSSFGNDSEFDTFFLEQTNKMNLAMLMTAMSRGKTNVLDYLIENLIFDLVVISQKQSEINSVDALIWYLTQASSVLRIRDIKVLVHVVKENIRRNCFTCHNITDQQINARQTERWRRIKQSLARILTIINGSAEERAFLVNSLTRDDADYSRVLKLLIAFHHDELASHMWENLDQHVQQQLLGSLLRVAAASGTVTKLQELNTFIDPRIDRIEQEDACNERFLWSCFNANFNVAHAFLLKGIVRWKFPHIDLITPRLMVEGLIESPFYEPVSPDSLEKFKRIYDLLGQAHYYRLHALRSKSTGMNATNPVSFIHSINAVNAREDVILAFPKEIVEYLLGFTLSARPDGQPHAGQIQSVAGSWLYFPGSDGTQQLFSGTIPGSLQIVDGSISHAAVNAEGLASLLTVEETLLIEGGTLNVFLDSEIFHKHKQFTLFRAKEIRGRFSEVIIHSGPYMKAKVLFYRDRIDVVIE